jgi:hypothetical protein
MKMAHVLPIKKIQNTRIGHICKLARSVDNVEWYKVAKRTAKQVVSEAMGQMYDGLYQQLGMKEGEKDIYRMAKS